MVGGQKKAIGVKGIWTSRNSHGGVEGPITDKTVRNVIVRAKKVILSCGTLWSPVILLNSGLTVCQTPVDVNAFLIRIIPMSFYTQHCRQLLTGHTRTDILDETYTSTLSTSWQPSSKKTSNLGKVSVS
jgi:hypothetical protein